MKSNETKEIDLFNYIDQVNNKWKKSLDTCSSKEQLHEEIVSMCVKCFKSPEDAKECDMCYTNTEFYPNTEEQLKINFIDVEE